MDLAVGLLYAIGSVVCHQLPERSFFWGDRQFPVCARCTSLYLSGSLGLIAWVAIKWLRGWRARPVEPARAARLFVAAASPTALSVALGISGFWDGSNSSRAVLAVPLGLTAGAIVAAVSTRDLR
jgi:uncharacterized membrane protein